MEFLSFPGIEGLHNVVKMLDAYPHLSDGGIVKYRGKIKLHGTNAGIRCDRGQVAAQSRTKIITPEDDNAGFARWVDSRKDFFSKIADRAKSDVTSVTIFGEWCGPGIMKGTAINNIPNKVFAIFAVMTGNVIDPALDEFNTNMITSPEDIAQILAIGGDLPSDVFILPWATDDLFLDFNNRDGLTTIAEQINKFISEIEPADPWVKATFGVDGVSEGIVYTPGAGQVVSRKYYSDLAFKAKGEKHKVNKTKTSVAIDPEVAASAAEFVTMFATEARFEQAVSVVGGDIKNIGAFLKWVNTDIMKESQAELEASELEWSDVERGVQTAARTWFLSKYRAI